mmetsp:Transcript_13261/g.33760  ORF Transcript_13261/g.33760 Transcript_13261/m.33760 type:complete len:252 (-) Transcript_13261:4-759(-)
MSSVSKRLAMLLMLSATAELTGAAKKMTEADIRSTVKLGNTLTERPDVLAAADPSMFTNGVCAAPGNGVPASTSASDGDGAAVTGANAGVPLAMLANSATPGSEFGPTAFLAPCFCDPRWVAALRLAAVDRCLFGLPRARLWARVRAAPKCIHVRTIGQRHGGSDSECVLLPARRRDGIAVAVARERVTRDAPARSGSPAGTDEIGHSPPYSVRVAADPSGRRWRLDRFHRLVPYIFRVVGWRDASGCMGM